MVQNKMMCFEHHRGRFSAQVVIDKVVDNSISFPEHFESSHSDIYIKSYMRNNLVANRSAQ